MKHSFKNTFPLDGKKLSLARVSEKYMEKMVCSRQKSARNEAFVEKYVSTIPKNCFSWQENQRKRFPLAGKCLSFRIGPPNYSNSFKQQKKTSEQKYTISTSQKISFHQWQ